ncbi:MAG: Gfo/Idh/MocA family oxidoreductase [Kiritimatiellae bacterium]|nr:Gfo/Idh/MocA family oxidoreductase [Kiritimatiellia bacterium]
MEKLRIVQVGCGGISGVWLSAMRDRKDVEIVGLVDLSRENAAKRAEEYGFSKAAIGSDLEAMLVGTGPDAVFDCTLPQTHATVSTTALRHGCHVLCEKPMAETMANARAMLATAHDAGKTFAVMQNRRYIPGILALRRFLDSGAIGRVTTVHCDFLLAPHFGGFRDQMQHPLLLDMAIHTFDQARFLSRQDALTVLAHSWNPPGSWYAGDASAIAVFEMTNQVVYNYRGSWAAEGLNTSWECAWRFIGDQGSVTWDGGVAFKAQVVAERNGFIYKTRDVEVAFDAAVPALTGHAGCIGEFIDCVRAGRTPQTEGADNIKSLAMVHGAIAAAQCGHRVDCVNL